MHKQPPAAEDRLVSCLCTQARHESPTFRWWVEQMNEPHRLHRKQWEWCYIAQALYERGKLAPGSRGLGFAVGREPLAALFARFGCEIVATDLDPDGARVRGWTETNQHAGQLADLNERGICPAEDFRRVSFRVVDMNDIPDDLTGFDFVWSSCSFEHLGSIRRGIHFIQRMMRCLRPGGVAVHTTEFNLSSTTQTTEYSNSVLFRYRDVQDMVGLLTSAGHSVEPLVLDLGDRPADRYVDPQPYTLQPHLKLYLDGYVTTSLGLIIQARTQALRAYPSAALPAAEESSSPVSLSQAGVLAWTGDPIPSRPLADEWKWAEQPPAAEDRLVSCLCTQARHESPTFRWWVEQMNEPHRLHRKQWEWCYIAQALYERGKLAPGSRGLGFAVGREPLAALFARFGCEIVATDDEQTGGLADLNGRGVCPVEDFRRVSFRAVDMNDVPDDLTGFDFVWSSCALERLIDVHAGRRFVERVMRCLRPGGVAVVTAGFNLSSNWSMPPRHSGLLFRRRDIQGTIDRLKRAGHQAEPLALDWGEGEADRFIDRPPYHTGPHLKLFVPHVGGPRLTLLFRLFRAAGCPLEPGGWDATSLGLILQAARQTEQTYEPPLRKTA